MMSLILLLIVASPPFNIVAIAGDGSHRQTHEHRLLRTRAQRRGAVDGIFITQGLVIGWLGVALGVVLGVALALTYDTMCRFSSALALPRSWTPMCYYTTAIPPRCTGGNIVTIACWRCCDGARPVYPAIRAARTCAGRSAAYE